MQGAEFRASWLVAQILAYYITFIIEKVNFRFP
jgi:hypothetical protein